MKHYYVRCTMISQMYTCTLSHPSTPPTSAALDVLHHQHAESEGLGTLGAPPCRLQECQQSQWDCRWSHDIEVCVHKNVVIKLSPHVHTRQEYNIIIERGRSLWYCVTTLYRGHDRCNDIHILSGFTRCSTTSQQLHQLALVLYGMRFSYMPRSEASSL